MLMMLQPALWWQKEFFPSLPLVGSMAKKKPQVGGHVHCKVQVILCDKFSRPK